MASGASFSSTNNPITIQNTQDPQHPLLTINLSNITKLLSTNYLTWSLQIQYLLEGYDLHHFIDGAHTLPPEPHNSKTFSASTTAPSTHQNTHPMTTKAKNNIHKPLTKMNLTVVISQPSDIEPHTINQALTDPKWRQAMNNEFDVLVWNGT